MNKKAIVVEMPIMEGIDFLEIAKTFDDEQLSYVVALAKAYSDLEQELQRKDNVINGIKKEVNEQLEEYEKGKEEYKKYGNLEDYAKGLKSAYISILDKIKELENDNN